MSRYYSNDYKQRVVAYYNSHHRTQSLADVATLFDVKGGKTTVFRWVKRGGDQSQRVRSGRPRILTTRESNRYIRDKVLYRNRRNEVIKYNEIVDTIREKTDKQVSTRTVQRYGRRMGIKQKRTVARTAVECNH